MKVIICGGRDYNQEAEAFAYLDQLHDRSPITHVISGMAMGADMIVLVFSFTKHVSIFAAFTFVPPRYRFNRVVPRPLSSARGRTLKQADDRQQRIEEIASRAAKLFG